MIEPLGHASFKEIYVQPFTCRFALVVLAATPLVAQEAAKETAPAAAHGGWSEPVTIAAGEKGLAVPWGMSTIGKTLVVVSLEMVKGGRQPSAVALLRSSDGGRTWQRSESVELGEMDGPPPVLIHGGRVSLIRTSRKGKALYVALDGITGAEVARHEIDLDLGRGAGWPTLVAQGDSLFVAGCDGQRGVTVHRSDDGGKTWARLPVPEEQLVSESKVLMLGRGSTLRLFFGRQLDGEQEIRHLVSDDGGKSWTPAKAEFPGAGRNAIPLGVARTAGSAMLLYARYDDRDNARLFVARSIDGERTWSAGEPIATIKMRAPSAFTHIHASPTGGLIAGLEGDLPKDGRCFVMLSADAGLTWRDTEFTAGLERVNMFAVGCLSADGSPCIAWTNTEDLVGMQSGDADTSVMFRRWRSAPAKSDK